ncbi:uncharacterized protein LOC110109454 [Dendrobium catenatum]|uniref:uncharacterized protein LOC110109454 n=1 Tax=Dendrobium catenatum TaxID=906689 RepID=UPI0009F2DA6F|nr:uncharacterized protein LOC110109454 [Dendrobium catenatum]
MAFLGSRHLSFSFAGFSVLHRRLPFPSTARRKILRCIRIFSMEESSKAARRYTNRLASEHSPYLLQHAHNPVDWYPWGDEAFEKARRRAVPIFLSIGYSTCHWCHVMEVESFENDEIARMLNEWFVSIKVDREERPDVDKEKSLANYREGFEHLASRVERLSYTVLEGNFMKGLKTEIRAAVKVLLPRDLGETMKLAQLVENQKNLEKRARNSSSGGTYRWTTTHLASKGASTGGMKEVSKEKATGGGNGGQFKKFTEKEMQ